MQLFFKELLVYTHHCNEALIATFQINTDKISEKSVLLFNHILNAHHNWNIRIIPGQERFDPWSIHPAADHAAIAQANFELSNRIIDLFDPDQVIPFTIGSGQAYENTVRNILFHVINHSTYHRGQIAMEFRQAGIQPPASDYIWHGVR